MTMISAIAGSSHHLGTMKWYKKPQFKNKLQQVVIISICWVAISLFISLHEIVVYDYETNQHFVNKPPHQDLATHIFYVILNATIGSVIGATALIFWLSRRFNRSSYGRMIFLHSLVYVLIIIIASGVIGIIYTTSYYNARVFDPVVVNSMVQFYTSYSIINVVITWYVITAFTVFLLQVNKKYGPWVLFKFVLGNYHKPRAEQRIFMFLDLKSSTTIAEKIGHQPYFNLLRRLYELITNPILNHGGEIYQYVGDEVVLTWPIKKGIGEAQCIACFYSIQKTIGKHLEEFKKEFSFSPAFRAGIHTGQVTAGEVGIIKKDIIYTGDVLNTSARIVNECRVKNVDLIVSSDLKVQFDGSIPYSFKDLGYVQLKGKVSFMKLYQVDKINPDDDLVKG